MRRVLIISTSLYLQKQIEEVAQHHNPNGLSLETTASFGQDITYWTMQAPDVLILDLPDDNLLQGYFFTKMRKDVPAQQPIIALCSSISSPLMQLSQHFSKIRMLKAPVDAFALYRTVLDVTREYAEGKSQSHPRYLTDQPIEINSDFASGQVRGVMKNLSLSGAYFEATSGDFELKVGDLAKLNILAGQQQPKQYIFDIKVVWSKKQPSGAQGYGVTFVDKEEVYNHLLKNL